jgi:hypothetical protein
MGMSRRWCLSVVRSFTVALLLALTVTVSWTQTFRGTILGTVTDASGAAVAGANVTVRNTDTGVERATQTNDSGQYSVPELQIGTYSVTVEKQGFRKWVVSGIAVDVAAQKLVDAQLQLGAVTQNVIVSAEELPLVETTSNTLGSTLTQENVRDLPINGRDYTKLIFLSPGAAGSPDQITDSPGSFGEFSMNGARGRSNNYLLDGTDMNDGYRNDPAINQAGVFGTPSAILPIDAVSELRVESNFQPEYGRNGGAVVNIVTRSGTNQFHGDAFEYFRNNVLDARNFFNFKGQPQAEFRNNQFGASLGGPIVKDKTFFFADYEGQREGVGVVTLACVPVGTAADGSLSPSQASNTVIQNLLARHPWPAPNIAAAVADGSCPNSSVTSPSYNNLTSVIGKVDHNFDQNNTLTGRYFFGDSTQSFPLALTASGGQLPGFNTVTPTRVQLVSLSYVHIFSPTKTNDLRYGWNRFAEGFFPQDQSFHPSSIGLCAASDVAQCAGSGPSDSGLPIFLVGSFAQLGATSSVPRHRVDTNTHVIDSFSWTVGKHDMRLGFEFRRTSIQQYFDKYFRGRIEFLTLSDFLDGNVNTAFGKSIQYSGDTLRHTFQNSYGVYFQDSYRLNRRLTLNYGLRWDYFGVPQERNNLFSNFDTAAGTLVQVGVPGGPANLYHPQHNNFGPRVSIAWDVFGNAKTVVRSGYGIFYDAFSQDFFLGHLPYPPFFDPGPAYNNIGPEPILSATATGAIAPNAPVYSSPPSCVVECDIFGVGQHIKTPYMENYNLNVQEQIGSKAVLQVGYVGSQGHRLFRFFDISQPSAAEIFAADCPNGPAAVPGTACPLGSINDFTVPRRFAFPNGSYYIMQENSTGKSNYNSLQASLRTNTWRGITSIINYVWSHSLDNSSDGEDFEPNAAQPNDSTNPQLEYSNSNFDVRNRFTWIFSYQLPKMDGSWQKLRNGWGFDSAVTLQSGQPFQLNYNFEPANDYSGSGEGDDRPDVVGPIVYDYHHPANFLQLSSFAIPCLPTAAALAAPTGTDSDCVPGTRHFGNERRTGLIGPTFKQWDVAIYKDTAITERIAMQLRVDIFNFLNHPNFANPFLPAFIADPAVNGFAINRGRETGTGALPITATGDVGIGNPFLGGGGPRGIQLAAKFTF